MILVYVALLSGIVDYVHTVGLRTTDITGSNKLLSPIIAATYVPEWVGTLCSGGAMLLFYIALYKGLQQIPKLSEMLKINVILWAVSYPLMFTSCFINEYSDAAVLIALITLIAGIANLVVQIRAGLFMCKNFSGNIADLGKWWIIYTVAYFVLLICAMLVAESNPNVAVILLIILIYPLYKSLTEFYVFLK